MFTLIIEDFYPTVILTLGLYVCVFALKVFSKKMVRLFVSFLSLVTLLIASDMVTRYLFLSAGAPVLRYGFIAVGYVLRGVLIEMMRLMVSRHNSRARIIHCIPFIVYALLVFSNVATNLFFTFTAENNVISGPLWFLTPLVYGFYICRLLFTAFKDYKNDRNEALVISVLTLFAITAGIVDRQLKSIIYFDFTVIASFGFYYVFQLVQIYRRDTLTDALDRRSFYQDLQKYAHRDMIVISVDMNDLKKINDQHGHSAGDEALLCIVDCMMQCFKPVGNVYRVGGDEFMVLCSGINAVEVLVLINEFNAKLDKTPYSVALGFAQYESGMNIDDIIEAADKRMYQNKRTLKGSM